MPIPEITVAELSALGSDITLIDVREHDEWQAGRIPFARHVPLATVPEQLNLFDGEPTYVICKVGGRSLRACEYAAAQGKSVVNVIGGMTAWSVTGLVTTSGH